MITAAVRNAAGSTRPGDSESLTSIRRPGRHDSDYSPRRGAAAGLSGGGTDGIPENYSKNTKK